MSATRTQVYLTAEQRARIDDLARRQGLTMAEVVRRALDTYLGAPEDPDEALSATFGAVPDLEPPSRDDWSRG